MKFPAAIIMLALCLAFSVNGAEKEQATAAKEVKPAAVEQQPGNFECIGRGFVNIGTCYFELPRCMIYDNAQVPFWGFIQGTVTGAALTGWRAFGGLMDIFSLGFSGNTFYTNNFPEYAWQAPWVPKPEPENKDK